MFRCKIKGANAMRSYAKCFSITNLYLKVILKSLVIKFVISSIYVLNKLNIFFLNFKGTIFPQTLIREPEGANDIIHSFSIGCLTHPQLSATDGHSLNLSTKKCNIFDSFTHKRYYWFFSLDFLGTVEIFFHYKVIDSVPIT
jgi:hypothetical protein